LGDHAHPNGIAVVPVARLAFEYREFP